MISFVVTMGSGIKGTMTTTTKLFFFVLYCFQIYL